MADLNMPNLNKKSDKYLFKNKLSLRRKSKRKLLNESFLMIFFALLLSFINFLIPNKNLLFNSFFKNLGNSYNLTLNFFTYFYQVFLVLFILTSIVTFFILILGSIYRLNKVVRRKTKSVSYK